MEDHLNGREYIVGDDYSIADMSAWGWINMAKRVFSGDDNPLAALPNIKRWFDLIEDRPAASRARLVGTDHLFKKEWDEETLRALFPSNY